MSKSKPVTLGVFYRSPNQANFMELIVKSFSLLNLKDNEIYLLGDFHINLLQNGKDILNRKGLAACKGPVHILINKYQEFLSNIFFKDTHRGKAPSNKTLALRKSTNMGVWTVGTLNQLFIRCS